MTLRQQLARRLLEMERCFCPYCLDEFLRIWKENAGVYIVFQRPEVTLTRFQIVPEPVDLDQWIRQRRKGGKKAKVISASCDDK